MCAPLCPFYALHIELALSCLQAKVVTDIETFEEKKLKLQKAMGEDLVGTSSDPTTEQRRQNLIS